MTFSFFKPLFLNSTKNNNKTLYLTIRNFSKGSVLPKRNIISPHAISTRSNKILKAIKKFQDKKPIKINKTIEKLTKIVMDLQPKRFMAPLNPCPVYNPKYGKERKNKSIEIKKIPSIYNSSPEKHPQSWVYSLTTISSTNNSSFLNTESPKPSLTKIALTTLDIDVFGQKPRKDILHRLIRYHLAHKRQGTSKQKNRSEVSGGGRKPYKQKGTGRARHGSIRSPIFCGGGTVFPKRPHDYSIELQRKVRRLGLKMALSQKILENNLKIIDFLPKNVEFVRDVLKSEGVFDILIVDGEEEIKSNYGFRADLIKQEGVHCIPSGRINAYALLKLKHVWITKKALNEIERKFSIKANIEKHNEEARENIKRMELISDVVFDS